MRNGEFSPLDPPVKEKLNAISWKMKNTAIVMTMNVCRRTCSAMRPKTSAMPAPMTPTSGSRAKTCVPWTFQPLAMRPSAYAPLP